MNDLISRQAAIDEINKLEYPSSLMDVKRIIVELPSAQPDRKLIDDYMQKIRERISPHTSAGGVVAINYYLEQIYKQIYGEGEKLKWMS